LEDRSGVAAKLKEMTDERMDKIKHTSDHDNTNASSPTQLNGARNLFTGGIQHTNTANEGQVSLNKTQKK